MSLEHFCCVKGGVSDIKAALISCKLVVYCSIINLQFDKTGDRADEQFRELILRWIPCTSVDSESYSEAPYI